MHSSIAHHHCEPSSPLPNSSRVSSYVHSDSPKVQNLLSSVALMDLGYEEIDDLIAELTLLKRMRRVDSCASVNAFSDGLTEINELQVEQSSSQKHSLSEPQSNSVTNLSAHNTSASVNFSQEAVGGDARVVSESSEGVVVHSHQAQDSADSEGGNSKNHHSQKPALRSGISLEQVRDELLLTALQAEGKRKIAVHGENIKCMKLEFTSGKRRLVIQTRVKGNDYRCPLFEWKKDGPPPAASLQIIVSEYSHVMDKLGRRPTTQEFKLHTKRLETVGDVLRLHLNFNVAYKHGEGSTEFEEVERLIRNHLSKPKEVTLPNKAKVVITLMDEKISWFSTANYEAYLKSFRETNGVHDKVVSRLKAAFNYAKREGLIEPFPATAFVNAKRIDHERHVTVSGDDMKRIFEYLEEYRNPDFVFYMYLNVLGHFRKGQVVSLRFNQFDFHHNVVRVKPKQGKVVEIDLPSEVMAMISARRDELLESNGEADRLFPSDQSESGHRTNFDSPWYNMMEKLGWKDTKNTKHPYRYCQHDFRETLLTRLEDFDDPTLVKQLGHLSPYALNRYRSARKVNSKRAAETSFNGLVDLMR